MRTLVVEFSLGLDKDCSDARIPVRDILLAYIEQSLELGKLAEDWSTVLCKDE